ncbi:hypothetical protein AK812_SmicGene25841 [Symbiodinium microadriaticum]|uniref:Uncharacterized protein n=1 Tax=Symbiodinium microadriaticum TaxID=2951 RepID=A0A1Q9DB82_SYMMI|nr:hypothetical protein AK812_SmicGene25841 [Symbiodinium microadriaticum]
MDGLGSDRNPLRAAVEPSLELRDAPIQVDGEKVEGTGNRIAVHICGAPPELADGPLPVLEDRLKQEAKKVGMATGCVWDMPDLACRGTPSTQLLPVLACMASDDELWDALEEEGEAQDGGAGGLALAPRLHLGDLSRSFCKICLLKVF